MQLLMFPGYISVHLAQKPRTFEEKKSFFIFFFKKLVAGTFRVFV